MILDKKKERMVHFSAHIVLLLICAAFLLPVWYTVSVSVSPRNSLLGGDLGLIPEGATFDNYKVILRDKPFLKWLGNSLVLAVSTVVLSLALAVPAAYALSRFKFRMRKGVMYLLLLLNAFPSILSMVAIYRLFRLVGLMNSYGGLLLVYSGGMLIFSLWNLKGYFDSVPYSIEEAAMIDGASPMVIMFRILLPLAMPVLIVTGVLVFITTWNEYIYAINFLAGADKFTLAAGLYSLQGTEFSRNWPVFAAGAILVTTPVLVVFFAIQRYMVSGLTLGGVKY